MYSLLVAFSVVWVPLGEYSVTIIVYMDASRANMSCLTWMYFVQHTLI